MQNKSIKSVDPSWGSEGGPVGSLLIYSAPKWSMYTQYEHPSSKDCETVTKSGFEDLGVQETPMDPHFRPPEGSTDLIDLVCTQVEYVYPI